MWVNDGIPDCILSNGSAISEDEEVAFSYTLLTSNTPCKEDQNLPCRAGHPRCFPIEKLCQYDLDVYNQLHPCRNGRHLEQCENIECSMKFLCPGAYCLSAQRVCDGAKDCPTGEDEKGCLYKLQPLSCPGMFRCTEKYCINQHKVCDGKIDCLLYGEDELYCGLPACPKECICGLNFI